MVTNNDNPLIDDLNDILDHTREVWDELRGARLFITGGTGFFGRWLMESFVWANDRLNLNARATVLSRRPEEFAEKAPHLAGDPAVTMVRGDVRTFEFPEGEYEYVIHAATDASAKLNQENPLLMFDTIVEGTRHTLEFARTHGARKLLFTSSGAVYGKQPPELTHIPEDYNGAPDTMDPNSAYGEGKRAAEMLCRLYSAQYGLETKIARCFAFVGPFLPLDAHFAIGNFIRDAINGGPIRVNGDGTPYRSYLYAADLAAWLWTILVRGESGKAYNVGSEEAVTIAELANLICNIIGFKLQVKILKPKAVGLLSERYVPSNFKIERELGLTSYNDLNMSIRKTHYWINKRQSNN